MDVFELPVVSAGRLRSYKTLLPLPFSSILTGSIYEWLVCHYSYILALWAYSNCQLLLLNVYAHIKRSFLSPGLTSYSFSLSLNTIIIGLYICYGRVLAYWRGDVGIIIIIINWCCDFLLDYDCSFFSLPLLPSLYLSLLFSHCNRLYSLTPQYLALPFLARGLLCSDGHLKLVQGILSARSSSASRQLAITPPPLGSLLRPCPTWHLQHYPRAYRPHQAPSLRYWRDVSVAARRTPVLVWLAVAYVLVVFLFCIKE